MVKIVTLSLVPVLVVATGTPSLAAQDSNRGSEVGENVGPRLVTEARSRDVLTAQVLLDRAGHSPGVIDGLMGSNTARAIKAYQRANGMTVDGRLSGALLDKLRSAHSGAILQRYEITAEDVAGPFVTVPSDMASQASLESLSYESPAEGIAEKFHMAKSFLEALNPGSDFGKAGTEISVVVPGDDQLKAKVARIEIDKSEGALRAYAADDTLVATYPATIGSNTFPSPDGSMEVLAVAPAPTYHFDPEGRSWGPDKKVTIAAGPNNPVGGTWIDLSKEGYGIHGTPDPKLIGKTSSHGCVRLTNWDAAELAKAVGKGTKVEFV